MAKSIGERTKQEANAKKARFVDSNLHAETQGMGVDIDLATGKPLKMGNIRRNKRVDKKAHQAEHIEAMQDASDSQNKDRVTWNRVESISIIGLLADDDSDIDEMMDRLSALREQIPDLFDIHDENLFDKLVNVAVPEHYVDLFKTLFEEQQKKYKMVFNGE